MRFANEKAKREIEDSNSFERTKTIYILETRKCIASFGLDS